MKKGYKALLAQANAEVEAISPQEAAKLAGDGNVVLVDIREAAELDNEGRIAGAKNMPRGVLEFWIDPESPYHRPVFASGKTFVFFCAGGWRSALTAKMAQDMGLTPVKHIEGGFTAWKEAGLPVETGAKPERS